MITKKPKVRCCRGWEIDNILETVQKLRKEVAYLQKTASSNRITIYSADEDVCVGMQAYIWHRIVCKYEGKVCLGIPRPYWQSSWSVDDKGFHLESFLDNDWKGWRGQYHPDNAMPFVALPHKIVDLHHKTIMEHIKTLNVWYPCTILNDFTGDRYYP